MLMLVLLKHVGHIGAQVRQRN